MPDSQSSEPGFESPFAAVSKIGHFRSLSWRPSWLSCINEYLATDSAGNVSDLVVGVIAAWLECFPEKPSWCRNEQVCQGRQKVYSSLSGPTDWILRYIKTTFFIVKIMILVNVTRLASNFKSLFLKVQMNGITGCKSVWFFCLEFIKEKSWQFTEESGWCWSLCQLLFKQEYFQTVCRQNKCSFPILCNYRYFWLSD